MITKEDIELFFIEISNKRDCDFTKKQIWGYYFLDVGKYSLKILSDKLTRKGYNFESIFEAEIADENKDQEYYLHMSKKEYHDIESLNSRNIEFYKLAKNEGILQYDGFDLTVAPDNIDGRGL